MRPVLSELLRCEALALVSITTPFNVRARSDFRAHCRERVWRAALITTDALLAAATALRS